MSNDHLIQNLAPDERTDVARVLFSALDDGPDTLYRYYMRSQEGLVSIGSAFALIVRGVLGDKPNPDESTIYARILAARSSATESSIYVLVTEALVRASYGELLLLRNIPADQLVRNMCDCIYSSIREYTLEDIARLAAEVDDFVLAVGEDVAGIVARGMGAT